jgi:predicted transcriptional regulator
MTGASGLNMPGELKERIELLARERDENPSTLIASALDLLLEAEALQLGEARRRLASPIGNTVPHERVSAWLETWGLNGDLHPPKCE